MADLRLDRTAAHCEACGKEISAAVKVFDRTVARRTRCDACAEARIAELAQDRRQQSAIAQEREQIRRAAAAFKELEVPPLFAHVTLDNFQLHGDLEARRIQSRVLQLGRRFVGAWPDMADQDITVLVGDPGTGKGHWMWSVVKAVVGAHGVQGEVIKLADMIRQLRAGWGKGEESELRVLTRLRTRGLLAIDEVSRHAFYGQQIHQHLYDVIDWRIEHQLPTILTSNEDEAGLREILRPAIFNRLQHHGQVIDFGTASWRSRPKDAA